MSYFVYFVTDGEYTKIGVSDVVNRRVQGLQIANGRKLIVLHTIEMPDSNWARLLEKRLHKHFAEFRGIGEWFLLEWESAASAIESIQDEFGAIIVNRQNLVLQNRFNRLVSEDLEKNYEPMKHYDKTRFTFRQQT